MSKQKIIISSVIVAMLVSMTLQFVENRPTDNNDSGKLKVVTSFYPLYFFAKEIGGDHAQVMNITPAGIEPHDYEPSPRDIIRIANSRLLILNGGGLETWSEKVKQIINSERTFVVVAGEGLFTRAVVDPHVWLSPLLAQAMVVKITNGFSKADPVNAAYYESNAKVLETKLGALNLEYQNGLSFCVNRNIVTSHAAFGHLAAAYNLTQVPIAGLSPDTEPSPRQIGDIVQLAKKNNVRYIFFESLTSPKLSETIAREIGSKTLVLNPIEGLTPGEISGGRDYFTEMRSNLTNLETACR